MSNIGKKTPASNIVYEKIRNINRFFQFGGSKFTGKGENYFEIILFNNLEILEKKKNGKDVFGKRYIVLLLRC